MSTAPVSVVMLFDNTAFVRVIEELPPHLRPSGLSSVEEDD